MMILKNDVLRDKILGCWNGKNIGGILGTPLEGKRGFFDVSYYLQKDLQTNPPANDDLDLQLVWLGAAEKYGNTINAHILGEYWLSFISPDWAEYGQGKANLRAGLRPPLSASTANPYRNSCGCFIRSEIWACLCPGNPQLAVRYAYEDAIIDHSENGMHGELFTAALQSAAFVENDTFKLLDIGLSYIPEDSKVSKAVRLAWEYYRAGKSVEEARRAILTETPCTFSLQLSTKSNTEGFPTEERGCDAPANIAFAVLGWLYGEGDFGKSLCIAVNCGEDADCSAATLGAILGILHGNSQLPEKWLAPVGGVIKTMCIDVSKEEYLGGIPKNVEELSDRVMRLIPRFLSRSSCDVLAKDGFTVTPAENLSFDAASDRLPDVGKRQIGEIWDTTLQTQYVVKDEFTVFRTFLDYGAEPYIKKDEARHMKLTVAANTDIVEQPQWVFVKLYTPEGIQVPQGNAFGAAMTIHWKTAAVFEFDLVAEEIREPRIDVIADISVAGRHTSEQLKITLFPKA